MEKRRILIVDNNDELRARLERVLGSLGHAVIVTGAREEALARKDLDQFDLIISDLTEDAEPNGEPIDELQRKHLLVQLMQMGRNLMSSRLSRWVRQIIFGFPTTKTSSAKL